MATRCILSAHKKPNPSEMKAIAAIGLFATLALSGSSHGQDATLSRIYKCVRTPEIQYCVIVVNGTNTPVDPDAFDIQEVLAATKTARAFTTNRFATPTLQCANSH